MSLVSMGPRVADAPHKRGACVPFRLRPLSGARPPAAQNHGISAVPCTSGSLASHMPAAYGQGTALPTDGAVCASARYPLPDAWALSAAFFIRMFSISTKSEKAIAK
jgi:hypothetical protein